MGGVARVFYDRNQVLPRAGATPLHVFLDIGDHLGSSAFIVDKDSGEVVERTTHQPYGALETDFRPDRWGAAREAFKFTGKEEDIEVGATYFGARYYHARLGRFMSADPMTIHGLGADPNPYAYVGGHVMSSTDPFGLAECKYGGDASGCAEPPSERPPQGAYIAPREHVQEPPMERTIDLPPVPFSGYEAPGADTSSAGGVRARVHSGLQVIPSSRADWLATRYPALAPSIRADQNMEALVKAAPVIFAIVVSYGAGSALVAGEGALAAETVPAFQGAAMRAESALQGSLLRQQLVGEEIAGARMPSSISGYAGHGLERAISRDGVGVSVRAIGDAVRSPVGIFGKPPGAFPSGTFGFVGSDATVILNAEGELVTPWATGPAGFRLPF